MLLLDERIHASNVTVFRCVDESLTSSINKRERGNDGLDRRNTTERKGKKEGGEKLGKNIRRRKCDETWSNIADTTVTYFSERCNIGFLKYS